MSRSPDREPQRDRSPRPTGIPFSKSLTNEQIDIFNSLRSQIVQALERGNHEFAGDLIGQLPRLRGEHLARIVDSLQNYPQELALFLDMMTEEEIEEFLDVLPDDI